MGWRIWALGALAFMGLGNFGIKIALNKGLSPAAVFLGVVLGELPLAVFFWWRRSRSLQPAAGFSWALAAGLATGIALILVTESFARGARAAVGTAVMNANFVLVGLLAWLVFKETLDAGKLLGLGCTLAGLWLMAR
jgi:uncharacterized membrane protein